MSRRRPGGGVGWGGDGGKQRVRDPVLRREKDWKGEPRLSGGQAGYYSTLTVRVAADCAD